MRYQGSLPQGSGILFAGGRLKAKEQAKPQNMNC